MFDLCYLINFFVEGYLREKVIDFDFYRLFGIYVFGFLGNSFLGQEV